MKEGIPWVHLASHQQVEDECVKNSSQMLSFDSTSVRNVHLPEILEDAHVFEKTTVLVWKSVVNKEEYIVKWDLEIGHSFIKCFIRQFALLTNNFRSEHE